MSEETKKAAAACLGVIRLDYDYPPAPGDIDHPTPSIAMSTTKLCLVSRLKSARKER